MLSSMTAIEFTEWQAFLEIEKPGERRMDWRFAQLSALVANIARGKKSKAWKIKDFMPDLRSPSEQQAAKLALQQAEAEVEMIRAQIRKPNGAG